MYVPFDGNSKELLSNETYKMYAPFDGNSKELLSNWTYNMCVRFACNSRELLSNGKHNMYVHLMAIPRNCSQIGRTKCASHLDCSSRELLSNGKHKMYVHLLAIPWNCSQIGRTKCASHFDCNSNELLSNWAYTLYITFAGNSKELLSDGMYVQICWQLHHMMSPKCHLQAVCSFCLLIQHGHFSIFEKYEHSCVRLSFVDILLSHSAYTFPVSVSIYFLAL